MSQYITNFKNVASIIEDYQAPANALDGAIVHLAWYGYGDYCGSSLVIFERDGQLFEVNASHCSCYGLEGQWQPEETSWEALAKRDIFDHYDGSKEANDTLKQLVAKNTARKLVAKSVKGRLIRNSNG